MDYNITGDIHPKLNAFDLSHNHFTTMSQGWLYPITWLECVPGDIFRLDMQALVRVQPLVAPILNNLTMDIHAFFVPTRLLWDKWEDFITTVDQDSIPPKTFVGQPPVWCDNENDADWTPREITLHTDVNKLDVSRVFKSKNTASNLVAPALWEYFGFSQKFNKSASREFRPVDFLRRAYYFIWNEWFRDENLQFKVDFRYTNYGVDGDCTGDYQCVLPRSWRKDYFTAGFTSTQKGTAPSLGFNGMPSAVFSYSADNIGAQNAPALNGYYTFTNVDGSTGGKTANIGTYFPDGLSTKNITGFLEYLSANNKVDLGQGATISVNDLRDMFAIQKFMERLMLSGSRYIEFLQSQFGVSPSDSRLQLPERIGGTSFNINISEVIQTSASTTGGTPQGTQTGHGLSVSEGSLGSYKAEEFGYIMLIANIQPQAVYTDRMPREMFRKTLLEQYNPHFVNLSFQAVLNREIYSTGETGDDEIFNYSGRYDEMREKTSYVTGQLYDRGAGANNLTGYIQYRSFTDRPGYNSQFIQANPSTEIFAVENEDPFICNFYFDFKALRPLPLISEPGLIDHVYGGK